MSFAKGFQHDVFISYAHPDSLRRPKWIEKFRQDLLGTLLGLIGARADVSIWLDIDAPQEHWRDAIRERVGSTATLVALLSPSFAGEGSICLEEIRWFLEASSKGPADGPRVARLFPVYLYDLDRNDTPSILRSLELSHEYDFKKSYVQGKRTTSYNVEMDRLGSHIVATLKQLAGSTAEPVKPARPDNAPVVYLASVSDDLRDTAWERLRRQLVDENVAVVGKSSALPKHPEAAESVKREIADAAVCIHMFGRHYGFRVADDPQDRSLPHYQYDVVKERLTDASAVKASARRLVWLAVEPAECDGPQRQFLEILERESDAAVKADVTVGGTFDAFQQHVLNVVDSLKPRAAPAKKAMDASGKLVYLAGHEADEEILRELWRCFGNRGFAAARSSGRAEERVKRDARYFRDSSGVVIIYGHSPADWVEEAALLAREACESRRRNPLVARICDGPPPGKEELPFSFPGIDVIDMRDGLNEAKLESFFDELGV